MAANANSYFTLILVVTELFIVTAADKTCTPMRQIYQFGDSISDTGNLIRFSSAYASIPAARPPYGETFFHKPTGRWSNGLLIVDFIAMYLKLFPINNYVGERDVLSKNGVNFAVAGSTALDISLLAKRGVKAPTNTSLSTQLSWFKTHLGSTCTSKAECVKNLRRGLILMGEIGANDISFGFTQGKSIQEIKAYVPDIINAIINAAREVIRLGAVRIVVPGNFPVGCFPFALTALPSFDAIAYDDFGCLKSLNELVTFQNSFLRRALASLRLEFPQAIILYADNYAAFESLLRRAPLLGFNTTVLLKSCCGIGGSYNYDPKRPCGSLGVPVRPNPTRYIFWEGLHLTQEGYRRISEILISRVISRIQCI